MIEPLGDYVLIKPIKEEIKTAGGLVLPEGAQEEMRVPDRAVIVKVGKSVPVNISEGLKVRYKAYGFEDMPDGKEIYKIGKYENIIAVERE